MTDYETGYYFVVLFIPLIPMGKKQILGDCSSCRRHRVMPLHQWNQMREEAIDAGMAKLAEAPDEPQRAIELLGTLTVFNRPEEAMDLASATLNSHQDDIDVQLGIGGWYENQGRKAEAESCFQEQMQSLRQPSENYEPALFLMLAQSYAGKGDHEAALKEYAEVFANVPEAATDKGIRKLVKKSEKTLGRSESILPKKGLFG